MNLGSFQLKLEFVALICIHLVQWTGSIVNSNFTRCIVSGSDNNQVNAMNLKDVWVSVFDLILVMTAANSSSPSGLSNLVLQCRALISNHLGFYHDKCQEGCTEETSSDKSRRCTETCKNKFEKKGLEAHWSCCLVTDRHQL